ncbi:P-loop NTPase fold protein [Pseudomonas sp. MPB26]|uniref:P-loop NTPase fold protein n=1 Tax=Pseudomonas sp. MPB26 TaxID=3388491 RepID=UPI0039848249
MINDANQHISEYLKYYLDHSEPRYAVMLNGGWGIGKTYLVKKILKNHNKTSDHYTYISLYGLTSCSDIDDIIFSDMHTFLDGKLVKSVENITNSISSYFRIGTKVNRKIFFDKFKKPLYIFDDLERCDIPINKTLGYINQFVEHKGKKAIIIANEKEINDLDTYQRIREKLIGKTLTVQSSLEGALDEFIAKLKPIEVQVFAKKHTKEIIQIYRQSGLDNLRILQQSLWDLERFLSALQDKHWKVEKALGCCMNLILPLSLSIKAGALKEDDITKRPQRTPSYLNLTKSTDEQSKFEALELRHPDLELRDKILSNNDLTNFLIKGIFKNDEIYNSINQSYHFKEEAETALETLKNSFDRTESKFNHALLTFEKQYKDRLFIDTDEILTTFSLRLWLANKGFLKLSQAHVIKEGKRYIDDLYNSATLRPLTSQHLDGREYNIFNKKYQFFPDIKSVASEEFFEHYKYRNLVVTERYHDNIIGQLLNDMTTDPVVYRHKISFASRETDEHIPPHIMQRINATEFVSTLLTLGPAEQSNILSAFNGRYSFTPIKVEDERMLLDAIKIELEKAIERTQSLFEQQRLASNIDAYLNRHLSR